MWRLHNCIQRYAWGSTDAIARLQGRPTPTAEPEAELWMGAHAKAPSRLGDPGGRTLLDAIGSEPASMLGPVVRDRFGARLPFLLKVLAAAEPLSLQAHPDDARARAGFDREEAAGVPRDAPHRSYRDPHAKPELVCALGPFVARCGFRALDETRALIDGLGVPALRERARGLWSAPGGAALAELVRGLLTGSDAAALVDAVVTAAASGGPGPWARDREWTVRLGERYPGDPGVVVALLLNLVELRPGDALFLSAGQLHCYLEGAAVEIMGSSDNVLRGGLTPKHVDVRELLEVLDRRAGPVDVLRPRSVSEHEAVYDTPAPAFALSRVELGPGERWSAPPRGPEVVLCVAGEAQLGDVTRGVSLRAGQSAFVSAADGGYRVESIRGAALFRATVGRDVVALG